MSVKILYAIQCHDSFEQVQFLISHLVFEDPDCLVVVHVDSKNDRLYQQLSKAFSSVDSVFFIRNRIKVNWSGFSQVLATIECMKYVNIHMLKFDYFILISGSDFPIRSSVELKQFLTVSNCSFIETTRRQDYNWRINRYNFFRECSYNRTFIIRLATKVCLYLQLLSKKRNNFSSDQIYFGSSWFVMKKMHLNLILDFLAREPGFIKKFSFTSCADEHFFQMIVKVLQLNKICPHNLHYIDFLPGKSSPKFLSFSEITLHAKKYDFFCRKVTLDCAKKLSGFNKID